MDFVRPKKFLGQHFLTDKNIANKIVDALSDNDNVLEIGPGKGILTELLLKKKIHNFKVVEIDVESVNYLINNLELLPQQINNSDVLKLDILNLFNNKFSIIGNFPYNISSQIFFKVLENKNNIKEVVCMVQKEVALRIAEQPGTKTYGILSVLLQSYFNIKYLFTVNETVFYPKPKVKSAVIKLERNSRSKLNCNDELFVRIVKTTFNNRRKTISNSIKSIINDKQFNSKYLTKRPEQLSVSDFETLTNEISFFVTKKNIL